MAAVWRDRGAHTLSRSPILVLEKDEPILDAFFRPMTRTSRLTGRCAKFWIVRKWPEFLFGTILRPLTLLWSGQYRAMCRQTIAAAEIAITINHFVNRTVEDKREMKAVNHSISITHFARVGAKWQTHMSW